MGVKFKKNSKLGVYTKRVVLPSGVEVTLINDVIYYTENPEDEKYIRNNKGDFEIVEEESKKKKK